jgi:hypothetical protein
MPDPTNPAPAPTGTPPQGTTPPATTPNPAPAADPKLTDGTSSLLGAALDNAPAADPAAKSDTTPAPAPKAPEAYTPFTLPEGVTLDETVLGEATTLFKEMDLPQEQAQKLVDFHSKQLKAAADTPYQLWRDTQETWMEELRSDPNLGKLIDNGTVGGQVAKMINSLPAEQASAFREALNFTGVGNNPAIVRGLYELSKRFTEPGHVQGNNPTAQAKPGGGQRPSAAEALYPKLANKET